MKDIEEATISIVRKLCFTLLELMIGISLILFAGGAIGIKLHQSIERKRFTSELERLRSRLIDCRQLAMNMQADWKGLLYLSNREWVFDAYTVDEAKFNRFRPLKLGKFDLYLSGKKVDSLSFLFASGGEVRIGRELEGTLLFSKSPQKKEWAFPLLFNVEESLDGKRVGPLHPDDLQTVKN